VCDERRTSHGCRHAAQVEPQIRDVEGGPVHIEVRRHPMIPARLRARLDVGVGARGQSHELRRGAAAAAREAEAGAGGIVVPVAGLAALSEPVAAR
jgi:hypothetical protein